MDFVKRASQDGTRSYFYYDFGRKAGQRAATGIFIYNKPKTQVERNHNKEALALLDLKKSQLILEHQSTGTGYIPTRKNQAKLP